MKDRYIMALDQGTTSARCILYDRQGKQVSIAQKEFRQIYPQAGWVGAGSAFKDRCYI